jgi:hypothetical protein
MVIGAVLLALAMVIGAVIAFWMDVRDFRKRNSPQGRGFEVMPVKPEQDKARKG